MIIITEKVKRGYRVMAALQRIFSFYRDGFAGMTTGRTLWKIIVIKLLILFGVIRLFFMPDVLVEHYKSDAEKATHVMDALTRAVPAVTGAAVNIKKGGK